MSFHESLDGAVVSFLNVNTGTAMDLKRTGKHFRQFLDMTMVLTAYIGGAENGTPIFGYQFQGSWNQQWRLEKVQNPSYWPVFMIRNMEFGTYVDLNGTANGTTIKGWAGSDTTNERQLWRLITADTKGRVFLIQNVGTCSFLDLAGGSAKPRTPIQSWNGFSDLSNGNQMWRMIRMD